MKEMVACLESDKYSIYFKFSEVNCDPNLDDKVNRNKNLTKVK